MQFFQLHIEFLDEIINSQRSRLGRKHSVYLCYLSRQFDACCRYRASIVDTGIIGSEILELRREAGLAVVDCVEASNYLLGS